MGWSEWLAAAGVFLTSVLVWKWLRKEPTPLPDKQVSSIPPQAQESVPDVKHEADKPAYVNKAFNGNDTIHHPPEQDEKVIITDVDGPEQDVASRHKISDVSIIFRPPSPDKKSISDIVIEKYDRKSKKLTSQRFNKSYGNLPASKDHEETNDDENELEEEVFDDVTQLDDDTLTLSKQEPSTDSTNDKQDSNKLESTVQEEQTSQITTSSVWKEKLKLDLLEDDEEFNDYTSDESDSDNEDHESNELNEVTKGSNKLPRISTPGSSINKILSERAVVVDHGSYKVRFGWAGEFAPISCFRNVVGTWRSEANQAWHEAYGDRFVGENALSRHSTLILEHPVLNGKIHSWQGFSDVIHHVEKELEADLSQHPVLITEPISVDRKTREKMLEVMIESIRTPGVCLKSQAAMCTLSTDHKVALVINSGYEATEIVPVYYGYPLIHAASTLEVGGGHLTEYLTRLVQKENGLNFASVAEVETINSIKEQLASVSVNNIERRQSLSIQMKEYELPDGQVIELGDVLNNCTEPIFNPGLIGNANAGLPSLVKDTLERIDPEIASDDDFNILLTGGNVNIKGFRTRLETEVAFRMNGLRSPLKHPTAGDNSAWVGSSILAEQSQFSSLCVTEDMYFEHGPQVVHRVCL